MSTEPKVIADRLIQKYFDILQGASKMDFHISTVSMICALNAVEEIINAKPYKESSPDSDILLSNINVWEQVKIEISHYETDNYDSMMDALSQCHNLFEAEYEDLSDHGKRVHQAVIAVILKANLKT